MTIDDAKENEKSLKSALVEEASTLGISTLHTDFIVDEYVTFYTEGDIKGVAILGKRSYSYKPGNIMLDLKKTLSYAAEAVVGIGAISTTFDIIKLALIAAIFIGKSSKCELSDREAMILFLLHKENVYSDSISEEEVLVLYHKCCDVYGISDVVDEEIVKSINRLDRIKAISIQEGMITLEEKVWGSV